MVRSPAMLRASKIVTLSLSMLYRPGLFTSPSTDTVRFMYSIVTTGSFIRLLETSWSLMWTAASSLVIPAR